MKNVKVKVISCLLTASLLAPAALANAEEAAASSPSTTISQQSKTKTASSEWKQYKETVSPKQANIKQNSTTISSLRKEIADKHTSIKAIKQSLKDSHKKLTKEDIAKIKAQIQVIKEQEAALSSLKGSEKADYGKIKEDVKGKNYQDAEALYDNIISIQNSRIDDLKKLSGDLDTLLNLWQTASNNAISK